ncbi:hypothetical protein [Alkalitalea saponilacus]|uniref:Uncharacterized protein n=1 Tax=Alkalitalea saponilacus TaxID=889453 RepID=A0A1T5G9Y1_9BACT|nr:hypothetical protein [Alkalitalea saponilacus]ASB47904.1 hypothetical protein CDL62_01430 [Alkalitalea saponilacus]SKC05224.1 hypothetical protein SAMN03080601_01787 [Alkalitalea saponilacus]
MEFLLQLIADMFGTVQAEETAKTMQTAEPEATVSKAANAVEKSLQEPVPETPNLFNVIQFR